MCFLPRVQAATLTVEADGSGQFTVIQDAVDAAQPGDTILIGPGEYAGFQRYDFVLGSGSQAIAAITIPLKLIGSGQDVTVVGPATRVDSVDGLPTVGIAIDQAAGVVSLEGLTAQNVKFPIIATSTVHVHRCTVRNGNEGLCLSGTDGTEIISSIFEQTQSGIVSLIGLAPNGNLLIANCSFVGNSQGMSLGLVDGATVSDNTFESNITGLQFFSGTIGTVENSVFLNNEGHVSCTSSSQMSFVGNTLSSGAEVAISIRNAASLSGSSNEIAGATIRTIDIIGGRCDMTSSTILNGGGLTVRCFQTSDDGSGPFDMTNNYWGTSEASQIAEWIHDGNDAQPNNFVQFEPFIETPISTQQRSFSDFKARFGPDED